MARSIRRVRIKDGLLGTTEYAFTKDTNFHLEVQGEDSAEIHIPLSELSAATKANPESLFKPHEYGLVLWDDSFSNPVRWAGPIVKTNPSWENSELVLICQGISWTLKNVPAVSVADRNGNSDSNEVWKISGDSYQGLINHLLSTTTSENSTDNIKLPQCFGSLSWTAGDLSKSIPLTTPPASVWDIIEDVRTSPSAIETVFVPQLADSSHVVWLPVVGTKANPYYRKTTSLGSVDLNDGGKSVVGFSYLNDGGNMSANWFFASSNATVKGNDNYTDLKSKWSAAPSSPSFMHRFGGESYDSELTSSELDDQITARIKDSTTEYKEYDLGLFNVGYSYTGHLGKVLTITDSGRLNGLSEDIRITAVDWNVDDVSSVLITVQPKDLTVFPRVPRHASDNKGTKNPGQGGGGTGSGPKVTTPSSKPEITTASPLLAATKGQPYTATIMATGSPAPTFALKSGDELPLGLSLSKTGQITGTPAYQSNASGNSFNIVATNKNGTDNKTFTLVVNAATTGPAVPDGWNGDGASYNLVDAKGTISLSGLSPFGVHAAKKGAQIFLPAADWLMLGTANLTATWPDLPIRMVQLSGLGSIITSKVSAGILPSSVIAPLAARITATTVGSWAKSSVALCFTPYVVGSWFYMHVGIYVSYGSTINFSSPLSTTNQPIKAEKFSGALLRATLADDGTIGTSWSEVTAPRTSDGKWFQPLSGATVVHGPNGTHVTHAGGIRLVDWQMDSTGFVAPGAGLRPELTWEHLTADHATGAFSWANTSVPPGFLAELTQNGGPWIPIETFIDSQGFLYETVGGNFFYSAANKQATINGITVYKCDGMSSVLQGWQQILAGGVQKGSSSYYQRHMSRVGDFLLASGNGDVNGTSQSYLAEKKLSLSGTSGGKEVGSGLTGVGYDVPYMNSFLNSVADTGTPRNDAIIGYPYSANRFSPAISGFSQYTIDQGQTGSYGRWLTVGRTVYQNTTSQTTTNMNYTKFSTDGQ